eukprot:TRINITY_DN6398_c0_g1_i1.p1 TRINITY_DN6398_c0_g1~~TRINITY_DN6398_c0_g1_i1.p1  ORF type:complete len:233 (-),score=57.09 TRINITY_DN6398_c0_g1_i1:8-706(-)
MSPSKIVPADRMQGDNFGSHVIVAPYTTTSPQNYVIPAAQPNVETLIYLIISSRPSDRQAAIHVYLLFPGLALPTAVIHAPPYSTSFGHSVAFNGGALFVSDPEFSMIQPGAGIVYLYDVRNPGNPEILQTLISNDIAAGEGFGFRIAAIDNAIAITSSASANQPSRKVVSIFARGDSFASYSEVASVGSNAFAAGSAVGHAIDFGEKGLVVGAPLADGDISDRGAVAFHGF